MEDEREDFGVSARGQRDWPHLPGTEPRCGVPEEGYMVRWLSKVKGL